MGSLSGNGPIHRLGGRLASARPGRLHLLAVLALVAIAAMACANGTYPLDIFYEMHYHQSYGPQEPSRLYTPKGAVPITGREVPLDALTRQEIVDLQNPLVRDGVRLDVEQGKALFVTNCAMCHGDAGRGDGAVLDTMREVYGYQIKLVTDLTTVLTIESDTSDGTIFGIISDRNLMFPGIQGWVMPQFRELMSAEERWMLVNYVRKLQESPTVTQVPSADGDQPVATDGKEIFTNAPANVGTQPLWCSECHTIKEVASGLIGPDLTDIGTSAGTRKPGMSAEDYIRESITDPETFVAEGVERATAGLMTKDITRGLTADQVNALVDFLLEQK